MDIGASEVIDVVQNVWQSFLNDQIEFTDQIEEQERCYLTGFIQITGGWNGAVVCTATNRLVRLVAQTLFGLPEDQLTPDFLQDALAEVTNMVGGNLKAILPGPSYLCLPAVIEGQDYSVSVRATHPVLTVRFVNKTEPFMVRILSAQSGLYKHTAQACGVCA